MVTNYCVICKPGYKVIRNNLPRNLYSPWPDPLLVLKPNKCKCDHIIEDERMRYTLDETDVTDMLQDDIESPEYKWRD